MSYCIPRPTAEKLIAAAKAGDAIGDISALYAMDSKGRRAAFEKHVGKETARLINTELEKVMVSNQKKALSNWVKKTFTKEAKETGRQKNALDKINELDSENLLNDKTADSFLEDLVADRLGITITPEEAQRISEKSRALEEAAKKPLTKFGPSIEYFKVKRDYENYLDSLTPTPRLKVATSIIGRATMLASLKSPLVNIESNTINAVSEGLARRLEAGRAAGLPATPEAKEYMKYANEVYLKTGYDITRMHTLADGKKRLGEDITHSQGPGKVRKVGRFYTDIVFNKLMTAPDVAFAAFHFADSANIQAFATAKAEGLEGKALRDRTSELFVDSTQIEPRSQEAKNIREKARLEAERGTYTNKNNYSDVALLVRKTLNSASGDFRAGDQLMPFVQVPAAVVGITVDYSGILLPIETLVRTKKALNAKSKGDMDAFKQQFNPNYFRKVTRAGLGITIAMVLSSWFDPEDFIGEYPTTQKERELLRLEKARENSVRIGNKWISMDYFGPLAAPFVGMMSAKKYGTGLADSMLRYAKGTAVQATRIPGFRELTDITKMADVLDPRRADAEELKDKALKYVVDFIRSRTMPAIVSDLAKGVDPFVRDTDKYDVVGRLMMNVPFVRHQLPQRLDIFGEPVVGEGLFSSMFFGARVKTRVDDKLIDEFSRLAQENQLPSITDVRRTSSRAKSLRSQIGEVKFREFYKEFGMRFKRDASRIIETARYKRADNEDKKNMLEKVKNDNFDRMLKKYKYRKPKKKADISVFKKNSPLAGLVGGVGNLLSQITPVASAARGDKVPTEIKIDGDTVTTFFSDGGYKSEHIDSDETVLNQLGRAFHNIGKRIGAREFNISEMLGFETREEKIKALMDYNDILHGGTGIKELLPVQGPQPRKYNIERATEKIVSRVATPEAIKSAKLNMPDVYYALEDKKILTKEVLAYALATIQHETTNAFRPVNEGYYNDDKFGYTPGFTGKSEARKRNYGGGENWYGRGYIQLTHKENYERIGKAIGVNLIDNPELANDSKVAAEILAEFFKSRGVAELIKQGKFVEARQKINPDDKGPAIAEATKKYLRQL